MAFLEHFRRRVSRLACTSVVAVVAAFVVSACGGDGVANPEPQATGNVQLELTGFPAGAGFGGVTYKLTRGDKEVVLGAGGSTSGVPTGTWTFTAPVVTIGGVEYRPEPASQTVIVSRSGSVNAQVTYTAVTGTLVVTASGLPALVPAEFTITGANGFTRTVKSISETFTALLPGRYTIAAVRVQTNAGSYEPTATSQDVTVVGGATANSVVAYGESGASVSVDVSGLPLNVDAAVMLTPPVGSATPVLRSSRTLGNAGRWTMSAAIVRSGGSSYTPTPARADSSVLPGDSLRFGVRYTLSTGALAVQVSGAPDGTPSPVSVTGPNGYSNTLNGTATLTDLEPGTYTLTASAITSAGRTYRPSPATRQVVVEASLVASAASFSYAQVASTLVVSVSGAPGGSANMIRVTGPQGYDQQLSGTTTLDGLVPGTYTVTAADIVQATAEWRASPASVQRTIAADARDSVAIDYAVSTGSLALVANGLPAGASPALQLSGPNGFSLAVSATMTVSKLAPGTYTIVATPVTVNGTLYAPAPASQQVNVAASLVAASATVTYGAQNAMLVITVSGTPQGALPQVVVNGPAGYTRTIGQNTTLTGLGAGLYTVSSSTLSTNGGQYIPSPQSAQRTLQTGGRDSVGIVYALETVTTGSIAASINGLPAGVASAITLTGPGATSRSITGTSTVSGLAAGTYTLAASSVTTGGTMYVAAPPSQQITVTAGATSPATVTYTASAAPTSDDLSVEYAYVTQAVQRTDGSVPLVANRAALLRVFVKNNRSNSLHPDVRVRVYNGATLLRTMTIAAPEASVRTSLDEGVLGSTWNTTLSAADMQPGLRILADVDPANGVAESDEGNNIWPTNGARAVTVSTVAPFSVRFVPVTVGALTGNVTVANAPQFLRKAQQMMPLESIVHEVRLPFVSSATELQSSDGNGAWLTVLNEMNALRSADGASPTTHYYGVVKVAYTSGVAGYGYVPGRAAMGWDYLPSGDGVAAHEWGHNFSRPHTPCGTSGDNSYPYAGGATGQYGWNSSNNTIVLPNATDFMSYCNNNWTSDWTWQAVMNYRGGSGFSAAAMGAASGTESFSRDGLLVWGRIVNGRVLLEPAFRVNAPTTAPSPGSVFRVEALDAAGNTLLDVPIDAARVDHVTTHEERQFAVVLPWTPTLERALASLRVRDVRTPLSAATRTSETARRVRGSQAASARIDAGLAEPATTVERTATRDRLRWNSGAFPMAVVRDAATGQTLGFLRRSGDAFVSRGRAVDVTYTDGVRSVTRRVAAGASR